MTNDERAATLREIASEAQRLRIRATNAGADMVAYLLENVLHEARAELGKRGLAMEHEAASPDGDNVVKLRPR